LCLFVFSIPWEKSIQAPGVGTLSHLFGILAFAAGAIAAVRRGSIRPPNLAMGLAALWVLWSALTYLWSLDRQATLMRAITLAELLAMVWLIWDACRTPLRQTRLMQSYVWGAVAASASTFLRYFQGRQTYYRRYTAPGFDPNDFGLILALSIPLALYLALRARGWERWCYRAAVLAVISAVLLTASRTALIATFAAFGFALWTWREADRSLPDGGHDATAARRRQPPRIACLPEGRAPKDRGLPSPHPGWVIAPGLLITGYHCLIPEPFKLNVSDGVDFAFRLR
jgi:hypothetical protein